MKACGKCGKEVTGAIPMGPGAYAKPGAGQGAPGGGYGFLCPSCGKGFCKSCALEAARSAGKGGFTCPECLSLIGDNPW